MFTFDNTILPVYIINLKERPDRLTHIIRQFENKPEFELHMTEAIKHDIGAVGLWQTIRQCMKSGIKNDDDLIIVCEDDHVFTEHYNRDLFIQNIYEAHAQGCDVLSAGIGGFNNAVPISINRFWIDHFWCTQFIVIYRKFFKTILNESYDNNVTADDKIAEMTSNKMVLYPFMSVQYEFGYSDVTKYNNGRKISDFFEEADKRLATYQKVYNQYLNK